MARSDGYCDVHDVFNKQIRVKEVEQTLVIAEKLLKSW